MKLIITLLFVFVTTTSIFAKDRILDINVGAEEIIFRVTEPNEHIPTLWVCTDLKEGNWERLWYGDGILTSIESTNNPEDAEEKTYTVNNVWETAYFRLGSFLLDEPLVLTEDLTVGSSGEEVAMLQVWLIEKKYLDLSGAYGYFGPQTQAALASLQSAVGISPAVGYLGPITRTYLESLDPNPVVLYNLISTEVSSINEEYTVALFVFNFEIENYSDDDIYVPRVIDLENIGFNGPGNISSVSYSLNSDADEEDDWYQINQQQTIAFELRIAVEVDTTGPYSVTLKNVPWSPSMDIGELETIHVGTESDWFLIQQ